MRTTLHLATTLLLIGATTTHAQITNPDTLIGRPPAPPTHQQSTPSTDLQWLWQYAQPTPQGNKPALLQDTRFSLLLRDQLKAPQSFWGIGVPLSEAAATFLAGNGAIASSDNRHLTITGCVVDHCPQRGLLWLDLGRTNPLLVFAALRWNEQGHTTDEPAATFTLWLFPNRELDPHQLPDALKEALASWAEPRDCVPPQVAIAIVVDPTGTTHVIGGIEAGIQTTICASSTGPHS